jgi:hypothetical protein
MIAKWLAALLVACILGGGAIPARAHEDHRQTTHGGGWPFHGDPAVEISLILATALATDQRPAAVRRQIAAGASVASIAANHGITADAVLQRQAALIDVWLAHAVERGRLPRPVADARAAWFKQAARLQIGQPGLQPRFPGLHELHVVMITAAAQTSGLPRRDV